MAIRWAERDDWGARDPRAALMRMPAGVRGVKVHYTGGREDAGMLTQHAKCATRVRSIQSGHMSGNGWSDVGYSYLVCVHGTVFVGRGFGKLPAANGPGLNGGHYAVLGMVGNSGLTSPTDAMLAAIRDVIDYLRGRGVGQEIKGHRDGYATDCPGGPLYAWVRKGAPRPAGAGPAPDPVKPPAKPKPRPDGEDVEYTSLSLASADAQDVPAGTPADVLFSTEHADPTRSHPAGASPSFLNGPASYVADLEVVLAGVVTGDLVETRLVEVKDGTSPGQVLEATRWRPTYALPAGGVTLICHAGVGGVQEGRKLRLQIRHNRPEGARIVQASARVRSNPS